MGTEIRQRDCISDCFDPSMHLLLVPCALELSGEMVDTPFSLEVPRTASNWLVKGGKVKNKKLIKFPKPTQPYLVCGIKVYLLVFGLKHLFSYTQFKYPVSVSPLAPFRLKAKQISIPSPI